MSRTVTLLIALVLVGTGCAQSNTSGGGGDAAPAPVPPPEVAFTIADQGVTDVPSDIQAGLNTIVMTNDGKDKHFPAFARINDGVSRQKVGVALTKGDFQTFFTSSIVAGAVFSEGEIDLLPGETGSLTTELTEGSYILADPEAKRFEPGYFEVESITDQNVEEPEADYEIDEGEYYIKVDKTLPAGSYTYSLTNSGEQGHELLVIDKKTDKEAGAALAPLPGNTAWITLDLEPGEYLFVCYFPDVKDGKMGKPHASMGMKTTVTVE